MKLNPEDHSGPIAERLKQGFTYRQISDQLGCHHTTLAKFVQQHLPAMTRPSNGTNQHAAGDPNLDEPVDPLDLLKAENKELRAQARRMSEERIIGERLLDEVRQITPVTAPKFEAPAAAHGEGKRHTHVLMLSDLHVGEVVNKEAMNGLGEYNFEILNERMAHIKAALTSFQNARSYPIEELRIWCLGDMVGGAHHLELAQTNEFPVAQQAWNTGMLLGQFVETLVEDYPRIHVVGIGGNHARMNQKPQAKQVFNSFDWLAQKTAELYLANYPTVTHNNPMSGFVIDKVAGKTVLLGHGDGIRSTMPGVPWGGVMRRFNNLKSTYAQIGEYLDYFALGHFHQANAVKGVLMNGAVKGPDEWVLKTYGTADPWQQLLLTFCEDTQKLTDVSYIDQ